MASSEQVWRICSSCKSVIPFETAYWVCNVSTCNRARTAMHFCSVPCWEAHLPMMRHREAWAIDKRSPSRADWMREAADAEQASRQRPKVTATSPTAGSSVRRHVENTPSAPEGEIPYDILIVASKLKKYIRARSGMKTSEGVMEALSGHVRRLCDEAIRTAGQNERKTVMDRDFPDIPPRLSD